MSQPIDKTLVINNLSKKSDIELIEILRLSQGDYNPLSIPIIKDILIGRGISKNDINDACNHYNGIPKTNQVQPPPNKLTKIFYWFLTLATLAMAKYIITQLLGGAK
jgi:hypothetical protein